MPAKYVEIALSEFNRLYRIISNLVKRCKRKDSIIQAQKEQLDILKNAMNSTKEL